MSSKTDIALFDRNEQLVALVEVKNKEGTTREWAAKLRRNLLAHGDFARIDYFVVVTPDRLYVWKDVDDRENATEPTYEIDSYPLLEPYFARAGVEPAHISGQAFEFLVAAWLADLTRAGGATARAPHEWQRLVDSGLLGAVHDGRVAYEVAA